MLGPRTCPFFSQAILQFIMLDYRSSMVEYNSAPSHNIPNRGSKQ